jgi:hypothetical protein
MDEVALADPQSTPNNLISIGTAVPAPASLPDDVAKVRAAKTSAGIGDLVQKDNDQIYQEIQAGREAQLREAAAAELESRKAADKIDQMRKLALAKNGPLDENDIARIMDPFNPNNKPVDPNSISETEYAKRYIGSVTDAANFDKTVTAEARDNQPDNFQATLDKGSDLVTRMEYFRKLREDQEAKIADQSWAGWTADTVKNMFQPYVEAKMRDSMFDMSHGVLLGTYLQNKADEIFAIPDREESFKQAKEWVESISKDNPQLGAKAAGYLEGLSSTDRVLDNIFTAMTPADYLSIARGVKDVAKAAHLNVTANQAVRHMVETAAAVEADPARRAAAAGDVSTAATERASQIVIKDLQGSRDPIELAKEPLTTNLNLDKEKIPTNPGNLSKEQVRRLQDGYDATGKSLIQKITDAVRINRIPLPLSVRNAVNVLKDAVLDYYPGIRNAVLDVSDPLYEPKSNTYWHEVTFGNFDGTLFSNPDTAKNFAKLHGFDDVRVVEGQGPITNAKIQELLDRKVALEKNITDTEHAIEANRQRMNDNKLPEADRATAKEQHEGLSKAKEGVQKDLDEVKLRLQNDDIYNRVSDLQAQADAHRAEIKKAKDTLKRKKATDEEKSAARDVIDRLSPVSANITDEIRALKSGKAQPITRGTTLVQQQGTGYKIVIRRPLVETDKAVRDLMIRDVNGNLVPEATSVNSQRGAKAMFNAALWRFRSAEDTLSLNENIQRKIGTYTQSLFRQWAAEEAKYIRQIASGVIREDPVTGQPIPYWKAKPQAIVGKLTGRVRSTYNDFVRTLEHARDAKDPVTGLPGYFFQTPGELQDHYLRTFDRTPSFAEHQAYFSFVRMVEGDRILREIAEFRNRARLGIEQFSIHNRAAGGKGENVQSPFFDGRRLNHFPGGDDVMLVMGKRLGQGQERLINLGGAGISPTRLEEYKRAVEEGRLQVIEIYAPEYKPLKDFTNVAGDDFVRYVLTDKATSKPIEFNHVNRRGGGHFEYDYDSFLKQARMYHQYENTEGVRGRFKSVYTGDNTFMPLLNKEMGKDIADKLHQVQAYIKAGKIDEAKAFIRQTMPIEPHTLLDMFQPGRDANGVQIPARFSLEEPFVVTPKNRSVLDMDAQRLTLKYGNAFKDASKSGSLNKQFQVAFNTERESEGLVHWEDVGSVGNPVYKYAPSGKMVDPITTMNKSLNRIVNTVFMDDYKMYAVEHWLREAEPYLEPVRLKLARSSPYWVFTSSIDKSAFTAGTPPEVVRNMLSNRYKINQFVGVPTTADTAIQSAKDWLVNASYRAFGPEANRNIAEKAITVIPNWLLSHVKDPITFLRSMTFHEKLGIFNPAQFLVQAQTYATILSVSPFHGTAGTYAAFLHQWSRLNSNPEILRALDNYATKMSVFGQSRWRPGEFLEAMDALQHTGFDNVAGEYGDLNTALKTDFVGNDFKNILHAGTFFFREGEKSTRLGAWYTAFREFREAHPSGALTKDDLGKILQRADLLTGNMSRASHSALNSGVLSLTTQFLNYQRNLAELFLGKRLGATPFERNMTRFRMLMFYSLLYGAPSAIGLSGLPMQNAIRTEAVQRGYNIGDNWLSTAVDQGMPAMFLAHLTGGGDWRKGNNYNIGDRLGSPGFTQFSDALKSDHTWWQLLAGASGTTLLNTLTSSMNFFHWGADIFRPNNERQFPLKLDDFLDIAKEITTVNQAWKLHTAINTGKWMSKNEGYVGDVTKANAAFMAIFGLSPAQQNETYIKAGIRKSDEEYQKYIVRTAVQELRRMFEDKRAGNDKSGIDHFRRATALMELGGLPQERKADVMSMAAKGYESMIDQNDYNFAFNKVPQSRSDFLGIPMPFTTQTNIPETRREQYRNQLQINRNKQ